ncbi:MAG TPA: YncE family protein [Terriglobales bacterium]|nr:YncE family protein [Terriglobales bacterium]
MHRTPSLLALAVVAVLGTGGCQAVTAAPKAGALFVAGAHQARVYDATTLESGGALKPAAAIVAAAFDRQRDQVAVIAGDGGDEFWSLAAPGGNPLYRLRLGLSVTSSSGLLLDAADRYAYAVGTAAGRGKLVAIDLANHRLAGAAMVGAEPCAVAANSAGTRLVIANHGDRTATLLDSKTLRLLQTLPLNFAPRQVATLPFGDQAYLLGDNSVAVYDMAREAIITYLPVGPSAQALMVKPDGGEVYVSNAAGTVSAIDTSTNEVTATMPAGLGAGPMAIAPDGSALYVGNARANTISVVSLDTRALLAMVRVGEQPTRLALGNNGAYLFVADTTSNDLAVVRTARDPNNPNTLVALLPAPAAPSLLVPLPGGP